jgi:hypothetical protein
MKWHKAMLDEQVPDSEMPASRFLDAVIRTRSIVVDRRTQVRILEKEPGVRKVTVMDHKARYDSDALHRSLDLGYMAATARGCWVVAEAVTR